MGRFGIGDLEVTDAAGRPLEPGAVGRERLPGHIFGILEANVLCSLATVSPGGAAHVNTAFFAYSDALELFFLSHPASRHCRNLAANDSVAIAVWPPEQRWADPGVGIQLFGTAAHVADAALEDAAGCYARRFPGYYSWSASLTAAGPAREYRLYRVVVSAVTIMDELTFGDGTFVRATIVRDGEEGNT